MITGSADCLTPYGEQNVFIEKDVFIEIWKCIEHINFPKTTVLILILKKSLPWGIFLTSFDGDASLGVD